MDNHFRIQINGVWMDILKSDIDLNDATAVLDNNCNPTPEWEESFEEEGELIYSLEEAKAEAKKQFFGKTWAISNGEIVFTKGDKAPSPAPARIFGKEKIAIPNYEKRVIRRTFTGNLFAEKVKPTLKRTSSFDMNLISGNFVRIL